MLDALRPKPAAAPGIRAARVANSAATPESELRVVIPSYDERQSWGPVHWAPRIGAAGAVVLPNKGDLGVVLIDGNDELWLMWEPA